MNWNPFRTQLTIAISKIVRDDFIIHQFCVHFVKVNAEDNNYNALSIAE
jgi:hypothetical protein